MNHGSLRSFGTEAHSPEDKPKRKTLIFFCEAAGSILPKAWIYFFFGVAAGFVSKLLGHPIDLGMENKIEVAFLPFVLVNFDHLLACDGI
jgi:hypothetical protein